ncbi:MAG: ATP synthase F1 subunit delta [Candidatus Omnitrophica bacterium]|nr:ATP synthase F1 subunit delta [Candidatus Omnitrophota bacterium]
MKYSEIKDEIVVKRYADAFIGYAKENIGLEKAVEDFKNLKSIIRDNPEFFRLLCGMVLGLGEKFSLVEKVLGADFSQETKNFLKLLLEKERIDKLLDITEYIRVTFSHAGEEDVLLKISFPLELETIKKIEDTLERHFNRKFKFYIDLDGSLLGGLQVIIGNTVIDGSVKRRLVDLKEKLMTVRV